MEQVNFNDSGHNNAYVKNETVQQISKQTRKNVSKLIK